MGMDAIVGPAALKAGMIALGLQAARLDYDNETKQLFGTIKQRGQVHHFPIPLGRTYMRDEICELLMGKPDPRAIAQPSPIGGRSPP